MKLQTRLILIIGLVFVFAFAGLEVFSYRRAQQQAMSDLRTTAERIYQLLMSVRRVYHKQFLNSGVELTDHTLGFLPAYAIARISLDYSNWDKSGLTFNNVSDRPRNPNQQADALELAAMSFFRDHPAIEERFISYLDSHGQYYYHFTHPIWIEPYCLKCHGSREQAPTAIRNRYTTAYDYKVGELRGVMSIKLPASYIQQRARSSFFQDLMWHATTFILLYLIVWLVVRRYIWLPVWQLGSAIGAVAMGHLAQRIGTLPGEFDRLARIFDKMACSLEEERYKLALSEQRFRSIANSTPDAIIVTDAYGITLFWNPGAEQMFGYKAAEAVGNAITCIIPQAAQETYLLAMARLKYDDTYPFVGHSKEITGCHRDGRILQLDISLSRWLSGGEYHYAAVVRDVTQRKLVETELTQYRQSLEEMVAARTVELSIAKELAETANRAKSTFLANMSHELRTPLNAILGFTQILARDTSMKRSHREQLQMINRSGQHLLALINDVLEISRTEAGKIDFNPGPFNLEATIQVVTEMVMLRASARNLGFIEERTGVLPPYVNGDAPKLRQVLLNLLSNAAKYADRGNITLRISMLETKRISFEVIDDGPGIPLAEQENIFRPFYQTTTGLVQGEGVGLGLAISREYVHLMGGKLQVTSAIGKGSCFYFDLLLPEPIQKYPNRDEKLDITEPNPEQISTQKTFAQQRTNLQLLNLHSLPQDIRDKLRQAAELLDGEATDVLTEQIGQYDLDLAAKLKLLVDDFRFDEILSLCENIDEKIS